MRLKYILLAARSRHRGSKAMKKRCLLTATVLSACLLSVPAWAATAVKKISFTSNNGSPPFDQAVTGVGLGVAGKAALFFWTDQTATGSAVNQKMGWGCAVASNNRWAVSIANEDNVSTTNNGRGATSARAIAQEQVGGAGVDFDADFKSWDGTDGNFTITWQTNPGAGRIIHVLIVGGADITAQSCSAIDLNATSGNQSYAHGLGATPSFGFFATVSLTTPGTDSVNATVGVGWAVSTTKRGSVSINADDGVTMTAQMDFNQVVANDRALICLTNAASTVDIELDFVSWDSTNITFNQINPAAAGTDVYALFLAGGQYDAGAFTKCTTASCTNTVTTAFQPKAVGLAMTRGGSTNRSVAVHTEAGFGAGTSTDGTQEGSISSSCADAALPTTCDQRTSTTKVIVSLFSDGTTSDEADLTGLNSTDFQVQWTTNNTAVANIIPWFAIGDAAAVAPRRRPPVVITSIEPKEYEVRGVQ